MKPNLSPQVRVNRKGVGFLSIFCLACHLWSRLSLVLLFSIWGISVQPNLRESEGFCVESDAVRNADRIWASTPQNRIYRAWVAKSGCKTAPAGSGTKIGRENRELNGSASFLMKIALQPILCYTFRAVRMLLTAKILLKRNLYERHSQILCRMPRNVR